MKKIDINYGYDLIESIEHIETELSDIKRTLLGFKGTKKNNKKKIRSIRKYQFCGMWKNRKDMKGLSTLEWLAKLRKEQWDKT
ncbi:MAG: hypothetical protein V1872_08300 [bacterium]